MKAGRGSRPIKQDKGMDISRYAPRIEALMEDIRRDLRADSVSINIEVQTPSRRVTHSPLNRDKGKFN